MLCRSNAATTRSPRTPFERASDKALTFLANFRLAGDPGVNGRARNDLCWLCEVLFACLVGASKHTGL